MIFFKNTPVADSETLFEAVDGEKSLGKCLLKLSDYAEIVSLCDCNDFFIAQGLVKSALNYAALRNIYMARFKDESAFEIAKAMKFELAGDFYESDIPTVLAGSCCSGK